MYPNVHSHKHSLSASPFLCFESTSLFPFTSLSIHRKINTTTLVPLEVSPIVLQMSRKSKRVCFSPDVNDKTTIFLKYGDDGGNNNDNGNRISRSRKRITRTCSLRLPKDTNLSPIRLLLRLGANVASAIRNVSMRRKSSRKVSSSTLVRSRSLSDLTDSHRAETVEDCIEFLHSSSSRERPS